MRKVNGFSVATVKQWLSVCDPRPAAAPVRSENSYRHFRATQPGTCDFSFLGDSNAYFTISIVKGGKGEMAFGPVTAPKGKDIDACGCFITFFKYCRYKVSFFLSERFI